MRNPFKQQKQSHKKRNIMLGTGVLIGAMVIRALRNTK